MRNIPFILKAEHALALRWNVNKSLENVKKNIEKYQIISKWTNFLFGVPEICHMQTHVTIHRHNQDPNEYTDS